ncbi:MAG: Clp protease N-terminal domain-containing protein [Thermomicrobiales bacterium]
MEDNEYFELEEGESELVIATEPIVVTDYSAHAQQVLLSAKTAAVTSPGGVMTCELLLCSLISDPESAATLVLAQCGFTAEYVTHTIGFIGGTVPAQAPSETVVASPRVERVLATAAIEAGNRGADRIDTLHLLYALIREQQGIAAVALEMPGVGHEMIGAALSNAFRTGMTDPS